MKKLSVVIPIYNVEKYLRQCIDSILAQTMEDYEIILVDDGSPDKCGEICDEYAEEHDNIFAYHKENGGLSDARNYGLLKASGQYVLFIDSDDYYGEDTFFEKLFKEIDSSHADAVAFSIKRTKCESGECVKYEYHYNVDELNKLDSMEKILEHLISKDQFMVHAGGYAIKREYLIDNQLFFEKGLISEDVERAQRLFSKKISIKFVDIPAYIYRKGREGSITFSVNEKNVRDLLYTVKKYASAFSESDNSCQTVLINYLAYQYSILCGLVNKLENKKVKKEIIAELKNLKWLLKYDLHPKVKKVKVATRILGIGATIKLLGVYLKYR